MKTITPVVDVENLVRELAENKVSCLELIREALSNAKDHDAARIWFQITKGTRNEVSVAIIDDGEGMNDNGIAAFWGVGRSYKSTKSVDSKIGYKGHGTKLYFLCKKLTVVTRSEVDSPWNIMERINPSTAPENAIEVKTLSNNSAPHELLNKLQLLGKTGTAIFIEDLSFSDAASLLNRRNIESYCDWFTVIGDIRSGLYKDRREFHQTIESGGSAIQILRHSECALKPLEVRIQVNGERDFHPMAQAPGGKNEDFYQAWKEDLAAYRNQPGLLSYGHRFADQHEGSGTQHLRNDFTSLRLTTPDDWVHDEFGVVVRIEGQRRQRETYLEASWQNHNGVYKFEERFGLWLCKDYLPIRQSNDLLRRAIEEATRGKMRIELRSLRCWQVFVNSQAFIPTANRNDISNLAQKESRIVEILIDILNKALKKQAFQDWLSRLSRAQQERRRDTELTAMHDRRRSVVDWNNDKKKKDQIEPMTVQGLSVLDDSGTLAMREPQSEQELFYLYSLLSARYEMPVHVLEYDASHGVDAIGLVRIPSFISPKESFGRIEFKYEVSAQNPIDHFFDAIDVIVCWRVDRTGTIYEEGSTSDTVGTLRKRDKSQLTPAFDTHEIMYKDREKSIERIIPIIQIRTLFFPEAKSRTQRAK